MADRTITMVLASFMNPTGEASEAGRPPLQYDSLLCRWQATTHVMACLEWESRRTTVIMHTTIWLGTHEVGGGGAEKTLHTTCNTYEPKLSNQVDWTIFKNWSTHSVCVCCFRYLHIATQTHMNTGWHQRHAFVLISCCAWNTCCKRFSLHNSYLY